MAVVALQPQPPPPASPKREYNMDYLKTPAGALRLAEGILSLLVLLSTAESYCLNDTGRQVYTLLVVIISMLESIFVTITFFFRLEAKVPFLQVPMTLLLNDGIMLVSYFITTTLALLAIGRCGYAIPARIIGALFSLAVFLVLVGLNYIDYQRWQESSTNPEQAKNSGTTVTESSPTVLQ